MTRRYPVLAVDMQVTADGARMTLDWSGDSKAVHAEILKGEAGDPGLIAALTETILAEALEQVRHAIAHADMHMQRPDVEA